MVYSHQRRPHIEKQGLTVVIYTTRHRIEGTLHVSYSHRALDTLNGSDDCLAITAARIYDDATNTLLSQPEFLAVNKNEIVFLYEGEGRPPEPPAP